MKDLLKIAVVLPVCFNAMLWGGQTAYSSEISTFDELKNTSLYDSNTQIKDNITFGSKEVIRFYGKTINIFGNNYTIDGNKQGYTPGFTPEADSNGTGFGFFDGTKVTIKDLNLNNFTHRERGTIYFNNSSGILDNITMTGFEQKLTDGHIWGSMVAVVDSSKDVVIQNSTFKDVDLTLYISTHGGDVDSDGGVLHVQGGQSNHVQSEAKILNSTFTNNKLSANRNIYGGAVYNEGIISEVSGSKFVGNFVNATGELTESTKPTLDGQMLKTGGFGGAFSLGSHYTDRGVATINKLENTQFINNTVSSNAGYARGGALWSGDGSLIQEIKNCTFTGNKSITEKGIAYGGAIYNNGNIVKIAGSTFMNNSVESPDKAGVGGAIYSKTNLTIQDGTTFSGNTVKYKTVDGNETIISNDIHLGKGADLIVTTSDSSDSTKNFVSILGGISSSQEPEFESLLKVQDGVTLNLSGKNDMLNSETFVLGNSVLNFTKTEGFGSFVRGTVNVESGSTVNFLNELTETENNGYVTSLVGAGNFNKTGAGHVEIQNTIDTNADGVTTKFTGNLNLDKGSLTVNAAPQTAKGQTDFTANIANGTNFTYNNGSWVQGVRDDYFTLNRNFNFKFDNENSNAKLNFTGNGTFTIEEDITNSAGNDISLDYTTTSFDTNTYNANYTVTNSTINLQDGEVNNVVFNNSFSTKGEYNTYNIDFDFTGKGNADKISATSGDAKLRLAPSGGRQAIAVLNKEADIGLLAGTPKKYIILSGATFEGSSHTIESDIYKYNASTTKGGTDLTLTATGLKADTLYLLNHVKNGDKRYFYFLGNDEYNVGQNLQETLAGTLYVNGKDSDPTHSVITGNNLYSFFQNDNDNSNLEIKNVTLQNAKGDGIAAVLDVNAQSTASFDNVIIQNNQTSGGKASAISNAGGTVSLKNVTFSNNTGADSYIYNSGTMNIETTSNRELTNGSTGNKITNDGTINFAANNNTYTVKSDIDNNGTINISDDSTLEISNNSGIIGNNSGIIDIQGGDKGEPKKHGTLLLTNNTNNIVINSGLKGAGNIKKSDSVIAEIKGNNSEFTGNVDITGGTLKFNKTDTNAFFNKNAVITVDNAENKAATLDYTTNLPDVTIGSANINLKNGGTLKFSGREDGSSVVKIKENIVTSDKDSTNNFIFNNADYTLGKDVTFYLKQSNPDNIIFNNAKARFEIDDKATKDIYNMGNAKWTLNNSEFRFLNKVAGDIYNFDDLTMKNSKISLDLDLTVDVANGKTPYADTFYTRISDNDKDADVIEIIRIGVTADNGVFYGDETTGLSKGIIQVFTDPDNKLRVAKDNNVTILNWGTNAYKYDIKSASSDDVYHNGRKFDSIEVLPIAVSTTGTLRELNRYEIENNGGNRGFSFIVTTDNAGKKLNKYNIYRDLDTTSEGAFSVLGTVDEEVGKSILDGTLKNIVTTVKDSYGKIQEHIDAATGNVDYITYDEKILYPGTDYEYNNGTYTIYTSAFSGAQTQGSMFEITRDTEFLMRDLVAQNAKRYATDIDKEDSENNIAGIVDGSVIYANNDIAKIILENVDVKENFTEVGNGGAIANNLSKTFEIENMKADDNTAGGLGGAIYTASNMAITDSDFGITGLNYHLKNGQNQEQNDIYIAGENTKLDFSVSADKTSTINSGLAGDGQFIKTGEGILNLNGKNDNLTGLFAVDNGKVIYTKDADTDSFAAGNVRVNGELEMAIEKVSTETSTQTFTETIANISSDTKNGKLTKTGEGILNLDGDNSGFIGTANINEGSVRYTATDATDSYISGTTNIAQAAVLDYTANKTSKLDNVAGLGTINYSGNSELTFNEADNTGFTGVINANGTQLNVTGDKTDAFGINIQNGILNFTASDNASLTLDGNSKIAFEAGTTGAEAIFSGGNSFTLGNIENVINNTVTFKDTTVKTSLNSYDVGNYVLGNNAILNLVNDASDTNKITEVSFANLSSNGGKLSIDVDLAPLTNAPQSDVLSVNNGDGTLKLTEINVLNSRNNKDDGLHSEYSFNVIDGANSLKLDKDNSVTKWATSVYEYDVDVNDTGKGIIMTALKASDANSLKAMNQYDGIRGFQFRENDDKPYVIGSNLETTAEGTFTVNGTDDTVISGDNKYSFFDVQNKTDLTINNVTITNAKKSNGTGAVINAVNNDSSIVLNNVTLEGNNDKNGKNDIYIAQGAKVTANDSSIKSGIAGAGTLNANNLTLSGKNDNFTGVLNANGEGVKFTQTNADDSYITGTTNISTKAVLNNDLSNIKTGNFTGNGTLTKEGSKDVVITGDNSNFKGTANINSGSISYNGDNTKYFGGDTIIAKDGALKVSTNNGTELSKISGEGTLSKDGTGTLTMAGDNSGFNGNLNVNNGIFALGADSSVGTIAYGVFADNTAINLQNTAAVQDDNGNWTTNPNPASIQNLKFDKLTLNGNVGLNLDVDLKNTIADTISANTVSGAGHLILGSNSINVISDSLLKNTTVKIADGAVIDTIILSDDAKTVMGPIQKYGVTYSGGNLGFTRQGGSTPSIDSVNPSVMASVAATQVGGYLTQLQTLQDGFYHMDRYSKYPSSLRMAAEMNNRNAINETPVYNKSVLAETSQAMWVKPYTSFESIHLKGGVNVSTITYGTLYGGDSDLVDLGHGFKGVISTFAGYNGSQQSYSGISMNQNGGTLGVTGTLYKGNFFTGLTASTGASAGEAYTQYGHDNFSMITAGIANKTGYNWEIKEGKMIVQPSLFLGYTFVNTFDYTNSAGVRIDSDSLNAITIVPGVKIIGNLKNGWQPYAGVDMVWNIMDKTNVMANDVRLPQLSVKPYVQYGVGVQKSWGDRFTAFFQTMIRNGGRNGILLTSGFRWAIGKNQVSSEPKEKKIIKQLEHI